MARTLDELDLAILEALQEDGRISFADLGRRVSLSPAGVLARVRRLEREDVIQGYEVRLNRRKLGLGLVCHVGVLLKSHDPELIRGFLDAVTAMPEVLECHHFGSAEEDYLLRVVLGGVTDVTNFMREKIHQIPGVDKSHAHMLLKEEKFTTRLPLRQLAATEHRPDRT